MDRAKGHAFAIFTILAWGFTFVSTKVLLESFDPIEILFTRFLIAFAALWVIRPRILRLKERWHELLFAGAGLCGVLLYFWLENIALQYASASNISIAVSTAPLLTAIVASVINRKSCLTLRFVVGFVVAMCGIVLISMHDLTPGFNPVADLLAEGAALAWAVYSNIIDKLQSYGYDNIHITKRVFAWGLVFALIVLVATGPNLDFTRYADFRNLGNFLFLGVGASGVCFVTWGFAVKYLGVTSSSAYIYVQPAITVAAAVPLLGEKLSVMIVVGIVLVLCGLVVAQWQGKGSEKSALTEVEVSSGGELVELMRQTYLEAFPPEERYPFKEELVAKAGSPGVRWTAYFDEELGEGAAGFCGFTYDLVPGDSPFAYVLFFAVPEGLRGKGYGSRILQQESARLGKPICLDIETVSDESVPNFEMRKRREAFYERNGFENTGVQTLDDGILYDVMLKGRLPKGAEPGSLVDWFAEL